MAGEAAHAEKLVSEVMRIAESDSTLSKDSMARAVLNAVLTEYLKYRSADDVANELRYIIDTLGEDEFVITRGC
jgi:uncharacterized protein (DUF2267 family)